MTQVTTSSERQGDYSHAAVRLSIVLTGRNDDHGGNFTRRLLMAAQHNVNALRRAGVSFEYLWVEWNPVADRPLLAERLVNELAHCRAFVAGAEVHRAYCDNPRMPIMEFFAKNAGVRRAAGEFILTTNADILLGDDVIEFLAKGNLRREVLYRAVRRDLLPGVEADRASHSDSWGFIHSLTPPYFAEGSGDFLLASRDLYEMLRGFDETIRHAKLHKDTRFCIHAERLGAPLEVIGSVYHLHHPNSWINLPLAERRAEDAPWGPPYNYRADLPYLNPPDWGLSRYVTIAVSPGIDRLEPPVPADAEANAAEHQGSASTGGGSFSWPLPTDPLTEGDRLHQAANGCSRTGFRAAFAQSMARLLRSRPSADRPAVAILRRYIKTIWRWLDRDDRCREQGVALYGAGRHAEWLFSVLGPLCSPRITAILDDYVATGQTLNGVSIIRPHELDILKTGAIVLSSDLHEERLARRCQEMFGARVRVVRLYEELPTGLFTLDDSDW